VLLISRQGKVRLTKWYSPYTQKERSKVTNNLSLIHFIYFLPPLFYMYTCNDSDGHCMLITPHSMINILCLCIYILYFLGKVIRELSGVILSRAPKLCNFVEWRGHKVVYKRLCDKGTQLCIIQECYFARHTSFLLGIYLFYNEYLLQVC
jgi:hypothetical protein